MRTRSTLILVGSFLAIIVKLKQTGCAILVAFLQWAVFRVSFFFFFLLSGGGGCLGAGVRSLILLHLLRACCTKLLLLPLSPAGWKQ